MTPKFQGHRLTVFSLNFVLFVVFDMSYFHLYYSILFPLVSLPTILVRFTIQPFWWVERHPESADPILDSRFSARILQYNLSLFLLPHPPPFLPLTGLGEF